MNAFLLSLLLACGGGEATPDKAEDETEEHADEEGGDEAEEAEDEVKPRVFFISPKDGDTVKSPLKMEFGVEGIEIKPAGTLEEGTGHHHIVIDKGVVDEGTTVPSDQQHVHYGNGQTTGQIQIAPGKHTLTLQFADGNHVSYGEPLSETITITVVK